MDLAGFAKIFSADGPFVSGYLDTHAQVEDAAAGRETAWKNAVRALTESDVDAATIEMLTPVVLDQAPAGGTRVVIASPGQLHLARWLPTPPDGGDDLVVGPLPRLLPLIEAQSMWLPHVVVLTDRAGADVLAYTDGDDHPRTATTGDVAPWPLHKTGTGGWAAKRFDASVEESWQRSAKDVAGLVEKVARDVDARFVVGCGDERAITLLRQHLPPALADNFVEVAGGGRHADGGSEHVAHRVDEVRLERAAAEHLAVLARFSEARGQGGGAREGVPDVIAALQSGAVETLLLSDQFDRVEESIVFGPDPLQLAVDPQELSDMGVERPQRAPLVDVVIRAAIGSGADVRVISSAAPDAPSGGIGALLRFDATSERA
ncbi:MAG: Vms1/Ankzf1 family peptidyl-tRNA hydrolase [Actinomycetes bacterium]